MDNMNFKSFGRIIPTGSAVPCSPERYVATGATVDPSLLHTSRHANDVFL